MQYAHPPKSPQPHAKTPVVVVVVVVLKPFLSDGQDEAELALEQGELHYQMEV